MYVARARSCTQSVHGRERPCTRAVNKALYRVPDRVGVPCTWPWTHHVHGPCTPVYTMRTRRERPSTRYVHRRAHGRLHGRKHGRVHGHGRTMYMARVRPCTQSVHGRARPCTDCARPPSAVYKLCTRPYTGHAHGPSVFRTRPCTQPVRGKTRPGTRPVPDRVCTVYMAVHGPCTVYTAVYTAVFTARVHGREHGRVHGRVLCTRPCLRPVYSTRPVNGRALPMDTAVFTARVRGRVPCTCTCLWPVYTAVHGVYGTCRLHHDTVHSSHCKS